MKRLLAPALAPLLLLAACDTKTPAPAAPPADTKTVATPAASPATPVTDPNAANFQHDPKLDVFGYYFTETPVKSGDWQLKSVNMGSQEDFASWEEGKHPSNYGPFFLEFEDVTSPTAQNELGQVYHMVSFRLQADSYRVDEHEVVFRSKDPRVGEVIFSGRFDVAALKAAKAEGPNGETRRVLMGGLQVGSQWIRNISFTYFAGE